MKAYIVSILIVGLALGGMGLGTFAWFTDTETVDNNYIQTGTLDLKVQLYDTANEQVNRFKVEGLLPGDNKEIGTIMITNAGTSDLKWKCTLEKTGASIDPITITAKVDGYDSIPLSPGKFPITLDSETLGLPSLGPDESLTCKLSAKFNENAGNDYQGKKMYIKVIFDATQPGNLGWSETA